METKTCQSCGMPMKAADDFGSNSDGSANLEYCNYCFTDGEFTNDLSMEDMIQINVKYLEEFNKNSEIKYSKEEALEKMRVYFPTLKRWKERLK